MEVRTQLANLGPVCVQETVELGQMVVVEGSFVVGRVLVVMCSLKLVRLVMVALVKVVLPLVDVSRSPVEVYVIFRWWFGCKFLWWIKWHFLWWCAWLSCFNVRLSW